MMKSNVLGSHEHNTAIVVFKNRLKHLITGVSKQFDLQIIQENSNESNGNQYSIGKKE